LARRIDGLVIHPVYRLAPSAPIYNELHLTGLPTILLGHHAPFCRQFVNLETDDQQASHAITQHLLSLGHKRIAFFSGPTAAPWAQERLEGYRRALREMQIEPDDHLVFNAGGTIEEGEQAAVQFLNELPGATALQAVNDLVAVGAAKVVLDHGLRIPQDLSLAGFGNCLVSEFNRVPLTTVRQPKYRLGIAVMETMERMLRGERPPSQRLSSELIIRASTGPAPA
jgi:DNA-binding LacI/PurR family transcriptional regulator